MEKNAYNMFFPLGGTSQLIKEKACDGNIGSANLSASPRCSICVVHLGGICIRVVVPMASSNQYSSIHTTNNKDAQE